MNTHATTKPVTDYMYCAKCGIDLPRPPAQIVGMALQCPCCNERIEIARPQHLWCCVAPMIAVVNMLDAAQLKGTR